MGFAMSGWNRWEHHPRHHHMGWGGHRRGFPFFGILPLLGFIFIFMIGLRSGWFIFFFVVPFFWFVLPALSKSFGGGEWSRDAYADEKRKYDEFGDDEKPKRPPTYVGDDGELSDEKRGKTNTTDDTIYYI